MFIVKLSLLGLLLNNHMRKGNFDMKCEWKTEMQGVVKSENLAHHLEQLE